MAETKIHPPKVGEDWLIPEADEPDENSYTLFNGLFWWDAYVPDLTGTMRAYLLGCNANGAVKERLRRAEGDYSPCAEDDYVETDEDEGDS